MTDIEELTYVLRRCKEDDTLYGPAHGSYQDYSKTVCGQEVGPDWWITHNNVNGSVLNEVTCAECLKALNVQGHIIARFESPKAVVCGGRHYNLTDRDYQMLDNIHGLLGIRTLISGCCSGADRCAEEWARKNYIPIDEHPANWTKCDGSLDRSAGPKRNREMAQLADVVIVFHGGSGTSDMRKNAIRLGIPIIDCTGKV